MDMRPFFDVPVYQLSEEQFEAKREATIKRDLEPLREAFAAGRMSEEEEINRSKYYGGSWKFNQIIGWIRLYFCGDQIRGEWWRIESKPKRRFVYREVNIVPHESIPKRSSSREIYKLILVYVARAQNDPRLKRRYVDTSMLERIGQHVDWNALHEGSWHRPANPQ
jgi:hypothetical protein